MKYLRNHNNISIHIIFYQNQFINECVRKKFLKFSERQLERHKDGKTEFFVRCRRTYVLNNTIREHTLCAECQPVVENVHRL